MNEGQNTPNTFSNTRYSRKSFTKKVPDYIFQSLEDSITEVFK
jgi:hypothetical protein